MNFRTAVSRALGKTVYGVLPPRWRLPFRYRLAILDKSIEPELRNLSQLVSNTDVAIDIGANYGLYAYRMSKIFSEIHAFEINDELTHDLARYNRGKIAIHHVGLSSKAGEATLYIPVLDGLPLTGWASLTPGNYPGATSCITKTVKLETLDSFRLERVSFIKIDVEGHELQVLEGATQTLIDNRPVVLIEIKEPNRASVFRFFSELNYVEQRLDDLIGTNQSAENHLFVPH